MAEKDTKNNQEEEGEEEEVENSDSWENLSNDEWTIVDKNSYDKDNTDANDDITIKDQEEFSGSTEMISASSDSDTNETEMGIIILKNHEEDSDGISVITESEAEQLVANKKFSQIDGCKNHVLGALKMYEKTEKTTPQVGTILNVVIACSLAAIIGLGVGRILGMDDKCPVSNSVDFSTIKIESENLINGIKELGEVKNVLDEIKASIPQAKRAEEKIIQSGSKSRSKRLERRDKKSSKISDTYIFDPDTTILEQLQNSLNTLCSVIDGMNPDDDFIKSDTLRTQGVVADLIEFKKIIFTVIKELEDTSGPKEMEFLRHAEQRIRDVCESLLNDLSYTVHGLTMKIHHKLNKVRRKLNKKLCMLKTSSESMDDKIFESLEENNSFLESCDKILNVNFKTNNMKSEKKEESNKKIYSKKTNNLKKRLKIKSISESEDETYPKDSSSDSSLPDLTYDHDYNNNNVWKKIIFENDSKFRSIRNSNSMKSSSDRSLKKLFMEVLVPAKTCSLSQEHYMELEFVYPEIQNLETSILIKKPLYSTILKSSNDKSLTKNKFDEQKLIEKEISDDAEAREQIMDKELVNLEISKEEEKDLTETKHDVTPSGSGINIETIKNLKERRNTKIREPIGKYKKDEQDEEKTPQSEEIIIPKKLKADSERSKSVKKSSKHCPKGIKCFSNNDSTESNESDKRSADSSTNFGDHGKPKRSKKEKSAKKKPESDENNEKKTKKEKNEKKILAEALKSEKIFKKRNINKKINDQLTGDWQLQRSRAREMHRDRNHRSEWFFDRADYRQDARKNTDEIPSAKSGAGRLGGYQSCKSYRRDYKCEPIFEERVTNDEDFYDYRNEAKHINDKKHNSNSRAGFTAKKNIKMMHHRNNIMQSKRR